MQYFRFYFSVILFISIKAFSVELTQDEIDAFKAQQKLVDQNLRKNALKTGPVKTSNPYNLDKVDLDRSKRMRETLENISKGVVPENLKGLPQTLQRAKDYHQDAINIDQQTSTHITKKQLDALTAISGGEQMDDVVAHVQKQHSQIAAEEVESQNLEKTTYFISYDMPTKVLNEILLMASLDPHASVIVRGMRPGMTNMLQMRQFTNAYSLSLKGKNKLKKMPLIELDNVAFVKNDIAMVPTVIYQKDGKKIRAEGLTSKRYLQEGIELGKSNLGRVSEVYAIGEPDFFDQIRLITSAIDWEKKKQQAIKRYWRNYQYIDLPSAQIDSTHYIDPAITMQQNIRAVNGKLMAYQGQEVNILKRVDISLTLFIFDGTNEHQVSWVNRELYKQGKGEIILITTKLSKENGKEDLDKLTELFSMQVYVLKEDVKNRFALKQVPAVISPAGSLMKIETFGKYHWGDL